MSIQAPREANANGAAVPRNQFTLVALILLCGLPFVGAWLLLSYPQLRPQGHSQHGTLYEPVVPLAATEFVDLKGQRFGLEALQGKWTLAWLGTTPCDARCDVPLGTLQRVRRALSEDANKAQVVGVLTVPPADAAWRARMEDDTLTRIIAGPEQALQALVGQMRPGTEIEAARAAYFLIDPRGNLVLSYAPNVEYKDILADLRHVIRYVNMH
ncbi:MAG: SCO family protein [Proteobacteria bacterium]|nr:SCO family protein [Pseudomonadota bacterium]